MPKRALSRSPRARRALLFSVGGLAFLALSAGVHFALPQVLRVTYRAERAADAKETRSAEAAFLSSVPKVGHIPLPPAVKAIYMTQCVVGTKDFRQDLVDLIDETELNAVVIDIKDYTGKLAFDTENPLLSGSVSDNCGARDMRDFLAYLHSKNIYAIGRITVFQDPFYSTQHPELAVVRRSDGSVWKDHKGLSFIDVGARAYWDYIVELSVAAYNLGFDELNYDYIRFPSDGDMGDIHFSHSVGKSKPEALEEFFIYLTMRLKDPQLYSSYEHTGLPEGASAVPITSADLFGMTTTNTDDLNIGQVLERTLPHFDFVAPMVYPSHYPKTWNGFSNPNQYPYEVVYAALSGGVKRAVATTTTVAFSGAALLSTSTPLTYLKPAYDKNVIRTWIQDFDYGGDYDIAEVKAQIQAAYDVGLTSFMVWAPSNRYTRGAFVSEQAAY